MMPLDTDLLRDLATQTVTSLAAGVAGAADVETTEAAIVQLESLIARHAEALGQAGSDFVFEIIGQAISPSVADLDNFTDSLDELSGDELAELAEADASRVEQLAEEILGARRELIADVQQTLGALARGALAAAIAGLEGVNSGPGLNTG